MAMPPSAPMTPPPVPPQVGKPPGGMAPPTGMEPPADDMAGKGQAKVDEIMGNLPTPTEKYDMKVVGRLYESLEEAWEAIRELVPDLPALPPKENILPPDYDGTGPLPASLVVPMAMLMELAVDLSGNKRYALDVSTFDKDAGLEKAAAQLVVLEKDKALAKMVKGEAKKAKGAMEEAEGEEDTEEAEAEMPPPGAAKFAGKSY